MRKTILQSLAITVTITIAVLAIWHCDARADDTSALRAYSGVGMDTTVVAKLGVEREIAAPRPWLTLDVPALVTLPVLRPGGGDVDVRAGLRAEVRRGRHLVLGATASPFVRTMSSTYLTAVGVGVDLEITPTLRFDRAAAGLELGLDHSLADHFSHTQEYRSRYYADVHDGWYQGASSTMRAGVRGEVRITRSVDLRARAGTTRTTGGSSELVPFYGEVGAAVAF